MSKRRASFISPEDVKPPSPPDTGSSQIQAERGPMHSSEESKFSNKHGEALKSAIEEVGGPFWDRILQLHGDTGSHSTALAGHKPHELWKHMCDMYCELADSPGSEKPAWFQLAAKSLNLNCAESGIREREVIQAAYDAYNWVTEEDSAIIEALQKVQAPHWQAIYKAFAEKVPHSTRSEQDVENRAVVLHRYHAYFHPLAIPEGLQYTRTSELNSFGLPWEIAWSEAEDAKLLEGINKVRGPYWGKILGMYGASGSVGSQLASKSETDLAARVREWWAFASGPRRARVDERVLDALQYIQPKGLTTSGMPTSRGWSDEQDRVLIGELLQLKTPNYNEILLRHGTGGRVSEKLAPKNYAQLRSRALKLYDFCIREKREMPSGLQYAKRKD